MVHDQMADCTDLEPALPLYCISPYEVSGHFVSFLEGVLERHFCDISVVYFSNVCLVIYSKNRYQARVILFILKQPNRASHKLS